MRTEQGLQARTGASEGSQSGGWERRARGRASPLSRLVRELRSARGEPGRARSGEADAEARHARSRADPERFDLARLSRKHHVPAHLIGRWSKRAAGARLLNELLAFEHERTRLLMATSTSQALRTLLALAGGGGDEDGPGATSAETRRKACVDLLKIGLSLGVGTDAAGAARSSARARDEGRVGRDVDGGAEADLANDAEFAERARAMLEEMGDETIGGDGGHDDDPSPRTE